MNSSSLKIQKKFDLSPFNTLKLRSVAENYLEITSLMDLQALLSEIANEIKKDEFIEKHQLQNFKIKILGGGSNLVLPPVIDGLVLKLKNQGKLLDHQDADHWFIRASAGEVWHDFVQWTLMQGFFGLENLSLIPGTVGAAPIQNIGAYGVEVKNFIDSVVCFDLQTGKQKIFTNNECEFSYRDSIFKKTENSHFLIWEVVFKLPKQNNLNIEYGDIQNELNLMISNSGTHSFTGKTTTTATNTTTTTNTNSISNNHQTLNLSNQILNNQINITPHLVSEAVISIRQKKLPDPKQIGNAGSFFKNPIVENQKRDELKLQFPNLVSYNYNRTQSKLAAGWLIDQTGWKGKRIGSVGMFEKQALVLVNHGGATALDVQKVANQVAQDVFSKFGVVIEPEPIFW